MGGRGRADRQRSAGWGTEYGEMAGEGGVIPSLVGRSNGLDCRVLAKEYGVSVK